MKVKRSQEEIVERIKDIQENGDMLTKQFSFNDLVMFLDYDHAREFLKEGTTREDWEQGDLPLPKNDPIQEIKDYMPFAWMKAMDERGISANRSVIHMTQWLWLAGDEELYEMLDGGLYGYYGTVALKKVCEKYDIPMEDKHGRKFEDHTWSKAKNE